jgi:hypothetical protein
LGNEGQESIIKSGKRLAVDVVVAGNLNTVAEKMEVDHDATFSYFDP